MGSWPTPRQHSFKTQGAVLREVLRAVQGVMDLSEWGLGVAWRLFENPLNSQL